MRFEIPLLATIAIALSACVSPAPDGQASPAPSPTPAPSASQAAAPITDDEPPFRPVVRTLQSYTAFPVALAFTPDGRLFYTEKGGSLRVIDEGSLQSRPMVALPTDSQEERGMLGVAVDPAFEENHYLWVYHSAAPEGPDDPVVNRVVRITEEGGVAAEVEVALEVPVPKGTPGMHNGGNLHFGPDGMLYVSIGDYFDPNNAQDPDALPGKIHRFLPGVPLEIPDDNPFAGSSTYAMGLRNPFDFTFDPDSGALVATENGPQCDDEINLILPGGNYGWRDGYDCEDALGLDADYPYEAPLVSFTPPEALTGITFYRGDQFPQWDGKLLVCGWIKGQMWLATLNEGRDGIETMEPVPLGGAECQTDVAVGPDGKVYFASSEAIYVMESPQSGLDSRPVLNMETFEVGGQAHHVDESNLWVFRQAGMDWVLFEHRWQPGASGSDVAGRVLEAREAGLKVLLSVLGPPSPESIDYEAYVAFLTEAATYHPDAIQVWDGMNVPGAWPEGEISAEDYVQEMLRPAFVRIKGIDPNVMVVSGALASTNHFGGCTPTGCDEPAYVAAMAEAGAGDVLDCVGVRFKRGATPPAATSGHPLDSGDAPFLWYFSAASEMYRERFGKPLCFTQVGYPSLEGYDSLEGSAFSYAAETSLAEQAAWLAEIVEMADASGEVRLLVVYNVDFDLFSPEDPQAAFAILRPDGSCPACDAIAQHTR